MAVKLEGSLHRYLGLSTDTKPTLSTSGAGVPIGSSFLETDTSRIYRWNGSVWSTISGAVAAGGMDLGHQLVETNVTLQLVLRELRVVRQLWELALETRGEDLEAGEPV